MEEVVHLDCRSLPPNPFNLLPPGGLTYYSPRVLQQPNMHGRHTAASGSLPDCHRFVRTTDPIADNFTSCLHFAIAVRGIPAVWAAPAF